MVAPLLAMGAMHSGIKSGMALAKSDTPAGVVIRFALRVVLVGVVGIGLYILYKTPPRSVNVHNFENKELNDTKSKAIAILSKFWEDYQTDFVLWWKNLIKEAGSEDGAEAKSKLNSVCVKWADRGSESVLNWIFVKAQDDVKPSNDPEKQFSDVRQMFYRFPGRKINGPLKSYIDDVEEDENWPTVEELNPPDDMLVWFDKSEFDPVQKVLLTNPKYDKTPFFSNMEKIERFDLFCSALPTYIDHLSEKRGFLQYVPVDDLRSTIEFVKEHGKTYDNPESLPIFLFYVGLNDQDHGCMKHLHSKFEKFIVSFDCRLETLVKTVGEENRDVHRELDMESCSENTKILDRVLEKTELTDKSVVYHAYNSAEAWRDAKDWLKNALTGLKAGTLYKSISDNTVGAVKPLFEKCISEMLEFLLKSDIIEYPNKEDFAREFTAWHRVMDALSMIGHPSIQKDFEFLKTTDISNPDNEHSNYINAVNASVYVESYIDDAKSMLNTTHTNDTIKKLYYGILFKDIFEAHVSKYTYDGIPDRNATDKYEKHISAMGDVYDIESLAEYSVRYWQGIGKVGHKMVENTRERIDTSLSSTLEDCGFPKDMLTALKRNEGGNERIDSRRNKGFFGGINNTLESYTVQQGVSRYIWYIGKGWTSLESSIMMPWMIKSTGSRSLVFNPCGKSGTIIYSKYPYNDGFHRYLSADRYGTIEWENNKFFVGDTNFDACTEGKARRLEKIVGEGDELGTEEITVFGELERIHGESIDVTENDLVSEAIDAKRMVEGFVPEPPDKDEEDEYCETSDIGTLDNEVSTAGLFDVIDVVAPPAHRSVGSKRQVIILSRSERSDDPRYTNKKLLCIGFDDKIQENRPVLIEDTPENRARAVLELSSDSINITGNAVLGAYIDIDGRYPMFLRDDGLVKSVNPRKNLLAVWILLGVVLAGALAAAVTFGFGAPAIYTLGLPSIMGGGISLSSTAVALGVTGASAVALATVGGVQAQKLVQDIGDIDIDANGVLKNSLIDSGENPFHEDKNRWMLVLMKSGLYPEFDLVPYSKPSSTLGSKPTNNADDSQEAETVFRDKTEGSTRVVFLPANETATNSTAREFPYMYTEHSKSNMARGAYPFYIYAPNKRMFLVPPETTGKQKKAVWIPSYSRAQDITVLIQSLHTDRVLGIRRKTFKSMQGVDLYRKTEDESQQWKMQMDQSDNTYIILSAKNEDLCLGADNGSKEIAIHDKNLVPTKWAFVDGKLKHVDTGLYLTVGKTLQSNTRSLHLAPLNNTGRFQMWSTEALSSCSSGKLFKKVDMLQGKSPADQCIKPWYVYQLSDADLTKSAMENIDEAMKKTM